MRMPRVKLNAAPYPTLFSHKQRHWHSNRAILRHMGNCCSGSAPPDVYPLPETRVASSAPIQPQPAARVSSTSLHRPPSRAPPVRAAKPHREATPHKQTPRSRVVSAPQKLQPQRDIEWTKSSSSSSPNPNPRARAQSVVPPRKRNRSDPRPPRSDLPRPPAPSFPGHRALTSTVRQVLSDYRFRILLVGKKGSGKSSLIKTVFKVNVPVLAALGRASGKPDVNVEYRPDDNRYLIVHECSGFEQGDAQGLQAIREFISTRTDQSRLALERLHAVW
ncbi:hypothetical protein BC826DRAFT_115306 [Russula brevipes]|nr:hypothetical protein BC826DRAFT_115306 [Russula brevipes]